MRSWALIAGVVVAAALAAVSAAQTRTSTGGAGSEACAGCHSEIYKSYKKTVMAGASGLAADALSSGEGEFNHKPSGVHYCVYQQDGRAWMSYERPLIEKATEKENEKEFRGERELLYFIGSGVKGRSYLFSVQGFLFETPINWYSQEGRWNMTPAYTEARESPMNLPAFVDCLNCHTSGMQAPVAGTDSKYSGAPFQHGGITCQRCHGSGEGHGAKLVAGSDSMQGDAGCARGTAEGGCSHISQIVNPAKLTPRRRDAICMECHFEGTVSVEQPGKRLYEFQPGEELSDYMHYFLLAGNQPQSAQGISQFEALSLSACKRKSGDKMWCGSCHDPHAEPAAAEKVSYFRGKCLACHGEAFGAKHHPEKPDCAACHMPALPSKDVAHTETTDHRIMRYPNGTQLQEAQPSRAAQLVAFPESATAVVNTRDLALAWETLAQRKVEDASHHAEENLRKAVKERPDDPVLLSALGFVEQEHGHAAEARELYERTLRIDPLANDAATNLGILEARVGHLRRAVELWQGAFARVPNRSAIGMNLAIAFCAAGKKEEARQYVMRVLEFNPDFGKAKAMLGKLEGEGGECKP